MTWLAQARRYAGQCHWHSLALAAVLWHGGIWHSREPDGGDCDAGTAGTARSGDA